jgi:hypothetical protein
VIEKCRELARPANFITLSGKNEYQKSGSGGTLYDFPRMMWPWTKR